MADPCVDVNVLSVVTKSNQEESDKVMFHIT